MSNLSKTVKMIIFYFPKKTVDMTFMIKRAPNRSPRVYTSLRPMDISVAFGNRKTSGSLEKSR